MYVAFGRALRSPAFTAPRYRVVAKCTGLTEGQSSVSAAQTVGVAVPINRMALAFWRQSVAGEPEWTWEEFHLN